MKPIEKCSQGNHIRINDQPHSKLNTGSPIHKNPQAVNFQRCKHNFSYTMKLVHASGLHGPMCILYNACAFVYSPAQNCREYGLTMYLPCLNLFKASPFLLGKAVNPE